MPTAGSRRSNLRADAAISPVVATILLVAIAILFVATVFVWLTGFQETTEPPEEASVRALGHDEDRDGLVDTIRVHLVSGQSAPYAPDAVNHGGTDPNDASLSSLYEDPATTTEWTTGTWEAGDSLYIECATDGNHRLTLALHEAVVLETTVLCEEASP